MNKLLALALFLPGLALAQNIPQPLEVTGSLTCNAGTNLNTSTLATSANQTTIIGHVDGIEAVLATIDADTGTIATNSTTLAAVDYATETTLSGRLSESTFTGRVGEVQASPTANTLLGRLKSIEDKLDTLQTELNAKTEPANTQVVGDGGGSLTVDAPVGTPAFVRLSDGASAISTLPVSLASVPSHAVTNAGTFAVQESGAALTALQLIDNFISGARGLVTEDNSAAILTALQTIDNMISGNEAQVDVVTLPALSTGTNAIGRVGHDTTGISTGRTTVTTAGTRVVLASSTACKWVTITAETDNTGLIVVGGTSVVASLATRQGTPLYPGESVTILIDNLNDVNIDSTVNGDGVTYSYGS